jgi:hypothetical protein
MRREFRIVAFVILAAAGLSVFTVYKQSAKPTPVPPLIAETKPEPRPVRVIQIYKTPSDQVQPPEQSQAPVLEPIKDFPETTTAPLLPPSTTAAATGYSRTITPQTYDQYLRATSYAQTIYKQWQELAMRQELT